MAITFADLPGEPALALFLSQVTAAVVAVQVVHYGLLGLAPLYALSVAQFGPRASAVIFNFGLVSAAHFIGVLLTIPPLMGVKVWKIQVNKVATLQQVMRDTPLVLLNFVFSVVCTSASTILSTKDAVLEDVTVDIANSQTLARQTVICLLMTEVWFYHVHRLFHENKRLYALIHKLHHTWPAPVAIVSTFAHPVEHIFCNNFSVLWGPMFLGAHPFTAWAYAFVFSVGAYGHHCGYWNDDMGMHDLHHEAFNVNYGNAHILDYLYGTYRIKSIAHGFASKKVKRESDASDKTQ